MLQFKSLELEGVPFFKNTKLDLSHPGFTLILGLNKDAGGGGNAAGKSHLVSHVPELILLETLNKVRRDRSKKGTRRLTFVAGKHTYIIEQKFMPAEKLALFRDGVDMGFHTLTAVSEELERVIGYNREEVFSLMYLNFRVPHPLVAGDTSIRKAFFSKFFRLHASATIRKLISLELSALNKSEGSLTELESRKMALRSAIGTDTVEDLEGKMAVYEQRLKKMSDLARRRGVVQRAFSAYESVRPLLIRLKEDGLKNLASVEKSKARAIQVRDSSEKTQRQWKAYKAWVKENAERSEELSKLRSQLSKLLPDVNIDDISLPESKAFYASKLSAAKLSHSEAETAFQENLDTQRKSEASRVDSDERLEECRKTLDKLRSKIDKCPVCGSDYDNKHAKREVSRVEGEIEALSSASKAALKKFKLAAANDDELKGKKERREQSVAKFRGIVQTITEILDLQSDRAPEKPTESEESLQDLIHGSEAFLSRIEGYELAFRVLDNWRELPEADKKEFSDSEDPTDRIAGVNRKIGELNTKIEDLKRMLAELEEVNGRFRKVKAALEDREPLELLQKAFSKGGVDTARIKALCSRLEEQANHYAPRLFPEDYRFSMELDTQFDILVHRRYGKRDEVSDVRKLSGAETSAFSLLLLITLMVFVPPAKRSSLLILDEPESALSAQSLERLVAFLPILNKIIPSIFIVTPKDPSVYMQLQPRILTVVKSKGRCNVLEGVHE